MKIINNLVKIANTLDTIGHYDLANELDAVIKLAAYDNPATTDTLKLLHTVKDILR
jgi:hypothetical protein